MFFKEQSVKPEIRLTVLFARKVLRSVLKVESTRFFMGKSYKQHQFNIFQTSQTELTKKKENYLEMNSFT